MVPSHVVAPREIGGEQPLFIGSFLAPDVKGVCNWRSFRSDRWPMVHSSEPPLSTVRSRRTMKAATGVVRSIAALQNTSTGFIRRS